MRKNAAATVAVCGATGRQGGAVARRLLESGWTVRALTRKPQGRPAQALAALGAEAVDADMNDTASMRKAFEGVDGVYSVQNGMVSGFDAEVAQGRNVAEAAKDAGVKHLVYGSAGIGRAGTGVPSWEARVRVEQHLHTLGLPFRILRPMAFMELMTDPSFYPAVGTWSVWPRLMGEDRPVIWIAVEDVGSIAALVFANRDHWLGRELALAADVRSLAECRSLYRDVIGRAPRTFPMPLWLFDRFTRKDLTIMWRWLKVHPVDYDLTETKAILPTVMTVPEWLRASRHAASEESAHR
jgi:uncharacterized protein YbjT (DUF2867 family)